MSKTPFNTAKLDEILANKRFRLEKERQFLLNKTLEWLDKFGTEYGIEQAYIFGSVTESNRFHDQSDIDVAVEQVNPEYFFSAISVLSEHLGRDVDIIRLNQCHFSDRIRQQGIPWTKTP
jgi:predicted nucleotidyltransferase